MAFTFSKKTKSQKRSGQRVRQRSRFYAEFPNCYYCGIWLNKKNRSVDHFEPKSKGGRNAISNLVTCCKKCNNSKGDRIPEEFFAGVTQ